VAGAAVLRGEITTALRRALLEELAAVGYGRLSVEAVARRAGVAKTAVYRRWSSKADMVLEVVAEVAAQKLTLPDTGSLRTDLELALGLMAHALRHPLASQIIPDLLAEAARNPQIAETLQRALRAGQHDIAGRIVSSAVARGELAPGTDPDTAADLIVGPLYWRLAVARRPLSPTYLAALAGATVAALGAKAEPEPQPEPQPQPQPQPEPATTTGTDTSKTQTGTTKTGTATAAQTVGAAGLDGRGAPATGNGSGNRPER
jgi:AcrR family transcriptional regulator